MSPESAAISPVTDPADARLAFKGKQLQCVYQPQGKVMFSQVSCLSTISLKDAGSLLGLVGARSVRILLECFLVSIEFFFLLASHLMFRKWQFLADFYVKFWSENDYFGTSFNLKELLHLLKLLFFSW